MINGWKKVVNAIMIFDTFDWDVCSVSLPLSARCHFHLRWKRSYRSQRFASESALICHENAKQDLESLGGISLSHKTRTGEGSSKVICTLMRTVHIAYLQQR